MPGANRPYGWAKFLSEHGYFPVIITRSWENEIHGPADILLESGKDVKHEILPTHEVYYVPYKQNQRDKIYTRYGEKKRVLLRRLLTFWELLFGNFFTSVSSNKAIYYFTRKFIADNPEIKLLIATGAPYMLFRFGFLLNKKFRIKWIADYRDDWNTSDIDIKPNLSNRLLRRIEIKSEKKWVRNAACYTTISPYSVEKNTKFLNKKGYTVYNGYMPEDFTGSENIKPYEKFTITFVGTLYPTQKIEVFLDAFREFVDHNQKKCNVHILFPGLAFDQQQSRRVMDKLRGYEAFYTISERVSKPEIIEIEQRSHVFLYVAHQKVKGIIGSKVYEYIGLKKPVILCPSDGESIEQILLETGVGHICNTQTDALNALNILYNDYNKQQLRINFSGNQLEMVYYYSRRHQAKVLANILDDVLQHEYPVEINTSVLPVVKNKYQQCTRCVMDTSDPNITFNENGYCCHCTSYFEKISKLIYQGEETDRQLSDLIDRIQISGKGKSFDCVVGVSGGVDSIYTAYLAKKLGLRPIAVHMDNGWNSELAVSNIEKILNKLNIELYTYVLDWEEFRDLQLAFLKASVVEAETPTDIAIPAVLHKVAKKYNVKYIFSGGNYATEGILPKYWHYNAKDLKYLNSIYKQFGTGKLKTFPTFGYQKEMYYKLIKGIRMIYLLNYVPYNKEEAVKILEQELEWKSYGGKHHESLYTKFIQSYILPKKFGIDYRRATFSTQICSGQIIRDEALHELQENPYNLIEVEEEKKYICKKLCITSEELNEIVIAPPKSYKDYPNDEKKLEFIYKVYRKLNR
jgi:N-acetyl sugar amidotransferase